MSASRQLRPPPCSRPVLNAVLCIGISWGEGEFTPKVSGSTPMIDQYVHKLIHLKTTSFDFTTVNLVSYIKNITKFTIIDSRLNGIKISFNFVVIHN